VYTIERISELSLSARKVLYRLQYNNVHLKVGDGTMGWPEKAPYDGISVTAGAPYVPQALKEQLADGGRLVIPVGGAELQLLEVVVNEGGKFRTHQVTACRFVKLVGEQGWRGDDD
jgi:protein-L-isoaspartate(D-aspartate) O-methyltransferase